jgi:endonuclease/exonuclease/phosphatase (EEP) superfamily protein YafD
MRSGLRIGVWLYLALVLSVWAVQRIEGDHWWLATLLLFGPRWLTGLPLLLFVPAATVWNKCLLRPLAAAALIVLVPIMGLCLPIGRLHVPSGTTVRILTCNVKGQCQDNAALNELIRTAAPDVVALQDCWQDVRVAWPKDWHVLQNGELVVASKYPLREVRTISGRRLGHVWPRRNVFYCVVELPQADSAFCCVHLPSPHYGIASVIDRKTLISPSRSDLLKEEIEERLEQAKNAAEMIASISTPVILAGDFNLPTDSTIYQQVWAEYWNAFSLTGCGFGYTEWPEVPFVRFGIRIDHILSGSNWRPTRCWVGPDVGSDHLPLIAELVWLPPGTGN